MSRAARTIRVLVAAATFAAGLGSGRSAGEGNRGPIVAIAASADSTTLAVVEGHGVEIRSAADVSFQRRLDLGGFRGSAVAFDPKGRFCGVAGGVPGEEGRWLAYDSAIEHLRHRSGPVPDVLTTIAVSDDGRWLAAGGMTAVIYLWALDPEGMPSGEPRVLKGHSGPVFALGFLPGRDEVLSGGGDRSLRWWSAETGELMRSYSQHTEAILALAFRPRVDRDADGERIPVVCASGGDDRTVRIWQPVVGRMVRTIRGHAGPILALRYAADGATLYTAGREGVIRRIDGGSDAVLAEWKAHGDWVGALERSPDGRRLYSGDAGGELAVWDLGGVTVGLGEAPRLVARARR